MTGYSKVYKKFLSKITDDMYMELNEDETKALLKELLEDAIHWFEFPRKPLDTEQPDDPDDCEDRYFTFDLTDEEINILATYMVVEWMGQQLATIELIRQKYSGADFKLTSQAAHLSKVQSLQKEYERKGFHLQRLYKRRKKDSNGVYRATMHTLMEPLVYDFSLGNEDPSDCPGEEDAWYERD